MTCSKQPERVITVRGAREHNLRHIDVDLPRERLVVVTGVSGSGKSSLVFDTIFAEGQRRYIESLSTYARQFLAQLKRPDVDRIDGLPPTIAVSQQAAYRSSRSTVATVTDLAGHLRLLFARVGQARCWHVTHKRKDGTIERCGLPLHASSPEAIVAQLCLLEEGTRLRIFAPISTAPGETEGAAASRLLGCGYVRARLNGRVAELSELLEAQPSPPSAEQRLQVEVDRVKVREGVRTRLTESVETALATGEGNVLILREDATGREIEQYFSEKRACPVHPGYAIDVLEPQFFNPADARGACQACQGLGRSLEFDEERLLPDRSRTLGQGAVAPLSKGGPTAGFANQTLKRFVKRMRVKLSTRLETLSTSQRKQLLHGEPSKDEDRWPGIVPILKDWLAKTESDGVRDFISSFMVDRVCPECAGERLKPAASAVTVSTGFALAGGDERLSARQGFTSAHSLNVADVYQATVSDAEHLLASIDLSSEKRVVVSTLLEDITLKLQLLSQLGLTYLRLDRLMSTLSGGEAQRVRLATQVGSGLVGAVFVLDEPTVGLHPRDNDRLIATLRRLVSVGNTVIAVEHDEAVIRAADHVVDIGPGAGIHGGRLIASGTVVDLQNAEGSLTGDYLSGRRTLTGAAETARQRPKTHPAIRVRGATWHNLRGIDVSFPHGRMTCVTGVSGSGKSTLVNDILLHAAREVTSGGKPSNHGVRSITGLSAFSSLVEVDQTPIGRTPRSNPATYSGIFDLIRDVFTHTPEARARGYAKARFSFNVKGGRCEACEGQGVKRIGMHFLPDVFVECEVCRGTRYAAQTLDVTYRGHSIADVLNMTFEDANRFFEAHKKIRLITDCLIRVGLGYLTLGQASTTLSGGEAQRMKLAAELWKSHRGEHASLVILDEPTSGLHFEDIRYLLKVLDELVDRGHTIVVIEHHLDVIRAADHVIDLGPEGGEAGGEVVADGTPAQIAACTGSHTGHYLAQHHEASALA